MTAAAPAGVNASWSRLTEKSLRRAVEKAKARRSMHLPQPCVFLRRCDTVSWCKKTGAGAWLKKGWVCSLVYAIVLLACAFAAFACCRSRSAQRQESDGDLLRSLNDGGEDATLPSRCSNGDWLIPVTAEGQRPSSTYSLDELDRPGSVPVPVPSTQSSAPRVVVRRA